MPNNNENNRPQNNPGEKRQKDMPNQNPDRPQRDEDKQRYSGKDGCGC